MSYLPNNPFDRPTPNFTNNINTFNTYSTYDYGSSSYNKYSSNADNYKSNYGFGYANNYFANDKIDTA